MIETQFQEWAKDELMPSDEELDYLEHYGVKGMKWGVRRTPEQLGHTLAARKKKIAKLLGDARKKSKRKAEKKKKERAKAKEKKAAKKAKKEEETEEQIREKLKTSTDPKYLYKHRNLMTTQEIQERMNRLDWETKLKGLSDKKEKTVVEKGEAALKRIANMAESASKVYDLYSKIESNARKRNDYQEFVKDRQKLSQEERARLRYQYPIDTGGGSGKKKKKDK